MTVMSEYTQGAYNVEDHNHTEWSDQELSDRLNYLYCQAQEVEYTGERLRDIQREMGKIVYEQTARYAENHNESVADSWRQLNEQV